jgi:hypothetical protein
MNSPNFRIKIKPLYVNLVSVLVGGLLFLKQNFAKLLTASDLEHFHTTAAAFHIQQRAARPL